MNIPPANHATRSIAEGRFHDPVNLIARLPTLMQKYDEIIKITDSQNPEFDFAWAIEEWMRRQLYIITAEEYGLRRYERLLGITPMEGESFSARRNHVLVRWNQQTPYTFRFLISLLEVLTDGNFEVIPNFHEYEMEIRVFTLDSGIISDLAFILRHIIPANIALTSSNHINIDLRAFIGLAVMVNTIRHYTITQDFRAHYTMTGRINQAGAMAQTKQYTIVQDFNAEIKAQAQKIGIGSVVIQSKSITISNAFNAEISTHTKVAAVGSVVKVVEYKI